MIQDHCTYRSSSLLNLAKASLGKSFPMFTLVNHLGEKFGRIILYNIMISDFVSLKLDYLMSFLAQFEGFNNDPIFILTVSLDYSILGTQSRRLNRRSLFP